MATKVAVRIEGENRTRGAFRAARSEMDGFKLNLLDVRRAALRVGGAVAGVFALHQLKMFGQELFRTATAAQEVGSKFDTVFGGAGPKMQAFLDQWATLAGLNRTVAKEYAGTAGAILQGMGFTQEASAVASESLLRLAGDLQSFNDIPIERTFDAIKSGLAGSWEPMDRLGIVIRQIDVNSRALLDTGKKNAKQLTQQEKVLATLALMYERAGVQVGDLDRTQESAANRARKLQAEFQNLRIELGTALLPVFEALIGKIEEASIVDRLSGGLRALIRNFGEVTATAEAFTRALVAAGVIAAIVRLTGAIRAADSATKAWLITKKGALALMGPRGWFVLGVVALTEAFRRSGAAARQAARDAADGVATYRSAVDEMDLQATRTERHQKSGQLQDAEYRVEQMGIRVNRLRRKVRVGGAQRIDLETAQRLLTQEELVRDTLREQVTALDERNAKLLAGPTDRPIVPPAPPIEPRDPKAQKEEVANLAAIAELRLLGKNELVRVMALEAELERQLRQKNTTLAEEIELRKQLQDLQDITGPALGARDLSLGTPSAPPPLNTEARTVNIAPEPGHKYSRSGVSRVGQDLIAMMGPAMALEQQIANGLTRAMYGFGDAVESAFSAMVTGRRQAAEAREEIERVREAQARGAITAEKAAELIAAAEDKVSEGRQAAAEAFKRGMLSALSSVAKALGDSYMAEAAAALGRGLAGGPMSAGASAGGAKLLAAATMMYAVAGAIGGAAQGGGGGGGGGFSASDANEQANRLSGTGKGDAVIVLEGSWNGFLTDPAAQDSFAELLENLSDRNVVVRRG